MGNSVFAELKNCQWQIILASPEFGILKSPNAAASPNAKHICLNIRSKIKNHLLLWQSDLGSVFRVRCSVYVQQSNIGKAGAVRAFLL